MSAASNIAEIRKDYKLRSLLEEDVDEDAIKQFDTWWNDAIKSNVEEPNAMTLATCTNSGKPSARIVLLKGFTKEGFIFFTNYKSKKGEQLEANSNAALVFFWKELERQVRIEGTAKKLSDKESDEYFILRPEQSRISAWSSPQSQVIKNRKVLEDNFSKYQQQFSDGAVVRPPHWGGYIINPATIEFWQGRRNRLHDRLLYTFADSKWKIERLAP
jgi:pyridoxamine 5'-phosphate oxidase